MNNKERSIVACKKQANKYRNPKVGDEFFNCETCYMCFVHHSKNRRSCAGCPLATINYGSFECKKFATYEKASTALFRANGFYMEHEQKITHETPISELSEAFEKRAKFYDWLGIELKKYPSKQFTKKGWKDFNLDINL